MSEADILELTYNDRCSVYRPYTKKEPTGETKALKGLDGMLVYEDKPCSLAKHAGGKLSKIQPAAEAPTEYCLFVRPEVDILPGDFLVVTQLGKTEAYEAGKADRHSSHNNIPVTASKVRI